MKFIELVFQNLSLSAKFLIIGFVMVWFQTNNVTNVFALDPNDFDCWIIGYNYSSLGSTPYYEQYILNNCWTKNTTVIFNESDLSYHSSGPVEKCDQTVQWTRAGQIGTYLWRKIDQRWVYYSISSQSVSNFWFPLLESNLPHIDMYGISPTNYTTILAGKTCDDFSKSCSQEYQPKSRNVATMKRILRNGITSTVKEYVSPNVIGLMLIIFSLMNVPVL